ncbi:hypothetical protein TYRP_011611 [Tyrophagus putrescentiae]|nr:hypothetical protein TYRP_011611 [Tyrophagus putrescentiae]
MYGLLAALYGSMNLGRFNRIKVFEHQKAGVGPGQWHQEQARHQTAKSAFPQGCQRLRFSPAPDSDQLQPTEQTAAVEVLVEHHQLAPPAPGGRVRLQAVHQLTHERVKGGQEEDDDGSEGVVDVPISVEEETDRVLPPVKGGGQRGFQNVVADYLWTTVLALLLHLLFEASTLRLLSLISNSSRKFSKNSTSINRKEEDNSNAKSKKMSERSLITVVKWKITEAQILRTRKSTQKSDISFPRQRRPSLMSGSNSNNKQ